ncbi:hypothetical protein [Neisseria sicca]|nr:hypothetical protein [Neisseria sicca]
MAQSDGIAALHRLLGSCLRLAKDKRSSETENRVSDDLYAFEA